MLGDGVSQLASNLFRFGSKKRGVCICNAQCRLQGLGEGPLGPTIRTHHGSLDRLLQQQQQQQQSCTELTPGIVQQSSEHKTIETGNSVSTESLNTSNKKDKRDSLDGAELRQPPKPPPRGNMSSGKSAWRVKEEFDRGVEVEKFYHQINGDIFEITRRVRAQNEDTIEQKCIRRKGSVRLPPEPPPRTALSGNRKKNSPNFAPRRQKSAEEVPLTRQESFRQQKELEWFDRHAEQRHSARSAEGGPVREETMEWLQQQRGPARTASGPSEMTVLKDEVPDWLLEHLSRKNSKQLPELSSNLVQMPKPSSPPSQIEAGRFNASSYAKAFKDELTELLKKPLSRQSSGPGDIGVLKADLLEWLKQLQGVKALTRQDSSMSQTTCLTKSKRHHRRNGSGGDTPRSHSQEEGTQQEVAPKRHSLGHTEHPTENMNTDWIALPLNRLSKLEEPKTMQKVPSTSEHPSLQQAQTGPPCCDRRNTQTKSRDRKLRHSASEVVNGGQPIYAKPHKERYQYVPKVMNLELLTTTTVPTTTPSISRARKHDRSRRNQTQRSATVSDMSGHLNNQKRKSSSAERAPRSPSPCTDPNCPLLPICTDPHCEFLDCRMTTKRGVSFSISSLKAKAQVHSVPDYALSETTTSPALPTSAPPVIPSIQTRRRLVICHECRSCAPILTCRNRKCLNATKCNSLPRCAADFNRLRTTLAQEPPTLDDIQPASMEYVTQISIEESPSMTKRTYANSGMQFRSNSQPSTLEREDLTTSLWQIASEVTDPESQKINSMLPYATGTQGKTADGNGTNGNKLLKSASAASLDSRRRRNKTVHFGEDLLREVCQNHILIKPEHVPSGAAPMKSNIQMLYNFVEGILSAWVDDDEEQFRSGAESEPEHGVVALKPIHRCNRLRYHCIKRIVEEAAQLTGTLKLGNSRYRHRHWRSTAKQCNEMFLRKVNSFLRTIRHFSGYK